MRKKVKKLLRCLVDPYYASALLKCGVAAAVEHEALLRTLPSFAMIVDVGANKGQFALVARKVFPNADIISFEPLMEPATRFLTVFGSDPRTILHQVAISDVAGTASMHVSARSDSSSLLPIGRQASIFPGTQEVERTTVRLAKLSGLIDAASDKSALLKIDVQGYEMGVLMGSEDLIQCFSHIYVECSFIELYEGQTLAGELIAWLSCRGFNMVGEFNPYVKDGQVLQCDVLFAKGVG